MATPKRAPVVKTSTTNRGRTTTAERGLSRGTLEWIDGLLDGVTLSNQAPDFDAQARKIRTATREVQAALRAKGGKPIADQRAAAG